MIGFIARASRASLGALALVSALPQIAVAAEFASTYTKRAFESCATRPSPHPEAVTVRSCAGVAGIKVIWTSEPDASSVDFGPPAGNAKIPGLDTFFEVRITIEWRGPSVAGKLAPVAAITRYDTGPSIGHLGTSRLVIYRLTAARTSCVMGVVRGSTPDANARAHQIVDRDAAGFVCGKSRVLQ